MNLLYLYDHRKRNKNLIGNWNSQDIIESLPNDILCSFDREDFSSATYVIGHFNYEEIGSLEAEKKMDTAPEVQIILCLTTQKSGFPKRIYKHKKVAQGHKRRFLLYSRNAEPLENKKIAFVFSRLTSLEAEAIVDGKTKRIPQELFKLLGVDFESLNSLFILSQGYIAACQRSTSSNNTLTDFLDRMGWTNEFLAAHSSLDLSQQSDKRDRVCQPNWWLDIFNDRSTLKELVEQEWIDGSNDCLPKALEDLLDSLTRGVQIDDPDLVGRAYLAIADRLSQV